MNLSEQLEDAKLELQISPLIDVVFLLLIYFIVTAQIVKIEGDIPFMLLVMACPAALALFFTQFFFHAKPPKPPSFSAADPTDPFWVKRQ